MERVAQHRVVQGAVTRAARSRSTHVPNVEGQGSRTVARDYENSLTENAERMAARLDPRQMDLIEWMKDHTPQKA